MNAPVSNTAAAQGAATAASGASGASDTSGTSDTSRMPGERELFAAVYREARLIDEKRWAEWYDLYAEEGVYWVPLTPGQPDGVDHTSIAYEDKLLLKLRIERMASPRAYSQQPPSRCTHVLQQPELEAGDPAAGTWTTRSAFVYVEARGEEQFMLAGAVRHDWVWRDGRLQILCKRVDLINCDAALPSIQLFP